MMALSLSTSFNSNVNSVMPLAQSNSGLAVRVASQASDTVGTLTVSGLASTATWSLNGTHPSWVTITSSNATCTLLFSSAQYQQDPYEFFISCTDGVSVINFPVYMEVRTPFYITANASNPVVSGTTLNIPSYSSSVADIQIQGFGLYNTQQSGCNFILPTGLPAGLEFVTSDESELILRVTPPHFSGTGVPFTSTDLVGGLQLYTTSPVAQPLTILAYQSGSFYDTPNRAYPLTLSISSQSQQAGVLDFAAGAYYDTSSKLLHVDAEIDNLLGTLQSQGLPLTLPLSYHWGATGTSNLTLNDGGGVADKYATYSIAETGTAAISLNIFDGQGLPVTNGSKLINFNAISTSNTSWLSTSAIKVGVAGPAASDYAIGAAGSAVTFTLSSPDEFNTSETIYFTVNAVAASSIESTATLTNTGLSINSGTPLTTVSLHFPSNAVIGSKWVITIAAANATSSPTRTGYAQVLCECTGLPELTIGGAPTLITSSTGTSISPIQLTASDSLNNPISATFELIGGTAFGGNVLGAPDGLYINSQNQISGNALTAGTYQFVIAASATGYTTSYSEIVTMTVTQVSIPLQITNPTSSVTSVPDNTTFVISWGISGNPTGLFLAELPATTPIRTVTGAGSATVQQVGSAVYSVYGTSYYGNAYSVPLVVISSSIASASSLISSPTIAVIDDSYNLTANWQPYPVNGVYTAYKGWNLSLQTPPSTGTVVTVFTDGLENGGTVSARVFEETLTTGDYSLNMTALTSDTTVALNSNPWDSSHTFPTALLAANVTFDNTNILLGQTLNITLNANYAGSDSWQVIFPDNTSTGWLPLSTRTVAKSFTTSGAQNIIIQTQNDFGTANPPVKLRRQLTQQIYVVDQQYNPTAAAQGALTGTLGIGGTAGFEITDASTGISTPQPYEVVVRSLARDTVTNELKLMVATSRFANASSLLSTMAIDVFPIAGRPHSKELITPTYILETNALTSSSPVKITTTTLPSDSYIGKPMQEFKMQATGGNTSYSWYATGMPPGLKMNVDGTISGTPTQLGSFSVIFAVMDSSSPAYIAETTLTFIIPTDLAITTTTLPSAQVGTPYENYTNPSSPASVVIVNTGGLAPYTWAIVAGSVPIGITINPSSGVLGGVPCTYNSTTDFSKTYAFTVQVTDAIGAKASKSYTLTLSPAPLSFGLVNQPTIIAGEQFKLAVPVFGGTSPYVLNTFSDNGIIGTGLAIASPTQVSVVAGITPSALTIQTTDTIVYPASYPANIAVMLTATGGVPSDASGLDTDERYKFYVDSTASNTLPGAVCYGPLLVASPTTNGAFKVTIIAVDSVGHITSKLLNITCQKQGSGQYTLAPYTLNTNGNPTNPSLWTMTPLTSGFPDPVAGVTYTPGANQFYCMVLLNNGSVQLGNGSNPAAVSSIISGALPAGMTFTNGNSWYSTTGADCVILLQGTPTTNGGASFEFQLSGINATSSTAQRASLNVGGGGVNTPVVAVTYNQGLDLDLNTLVANSIGSYSWAYPLLAEGGTAPYVFSIQSGTTLPSITTAVSINNLPAFSSSTSTVGSYSVIVVATDSNGHASSPATIPVKIAKSTTQPIHILDNNIPTSVYVHRSIPTNTYYVDSDLIANWTATGLPAGVTLSSTPSTRVYLQGTPTQVTSSASITITATSVIYGTSTSVTVSMAVAAQTATILTPSHTGATATIGTQYRVVNNNAIISVQYVGFQPGDTNLPLLVNTLSSATLGSPSTTIGGQPTTGNTNVTSTGFVMSYDYIPTGSGTDTLTFNNSAFTDSVTITETYSALVATARTIAVSVSEYTVTQVLALPVTISGGNPPYSISITGVTDSRFVAINSGTPSAALQVTVNEFAASTTPYICNVPMVITDNASNSVNVTGQVQLTVQAQTYIGVVFSDYTWNIHLQTPAEPQVGSIIPNQLMSTPQAYLGHPPYTYNVTSVTIPSGISSFIQASPTKRVLAFNLTETGTAASVNDVDGSAQTPTGSYNVSATNFATAETLVGTYTIAVSLEVEDSLGITTLGPGTQPTQPITKNITVNIINS
jgi:hypothetical protein